MRLKTEYTINVSLLCRDSARLVLNVKLNLKNGYDLGNNIINNATRELNENSFMKNFIYVARIHEDGVADKQTYFVRVSFLLILV